jgi:DNA-binding CsgD family transcriptional regulator
VVSVTKASVASLDQGERRAARPTSAEAARAARRARVEAALERALDAVGAPAFLVSRAGDIVLANARARRLSVRSRERARRSLLGPLSRGRGDETWELFSLPSDRVSSGYLAVLRAAPSNEAEPPTNEDAKHRWGLTARQGQVLDLIARGYTNALVAEELGISEGTVEFHLTALFDKAGVSNRATLIVKLFEVVE